MEGEINKDSKPREEICVHVHAPSPEDNFLPELDNHVFDIAPFRQTFFRYSMYGQSEVVKSSSFVYASHHSAQSSRLDIKKLSVSLVGNNEIPNLGLFAPTVNEIYFMGHITYPTTAFNMLSQLTSLKTVVFNIGLGGHINEFQETSQEFHNPTIEIPSVTTLEIKINHQLYHSRPDESKDIFNRIIKSVLKHSADSFPNLKNITIDLPNTSLFSHCTTFLVNSKENLRTVHEVIKTDDKIQVRKKPVVHSTSLPFDPCAYFPSSSQYNILRVIDILGFNPSP